MPNRLASATSPYLLQHKDNPVDWWPWCAEAFEEAQRLDKPVLLSVGYAACHWCHVMAHESFEDPQVAALMNERFVNVKVDREERPDVDAVYMEAVQATTGHGGWPMTAFCTPTGEPFFCGTYFPPRSSHGLPSFTQVLESISVAWRTGRDDVLTGASRIAEHLARAPMPAGERPPGEAELGQAFTALTREFDAEHAGFGGAPKFPPAMLLEFLLRYHARTGEARALEMVERTGEAMARGGMYDQLGGGFARYSVDAGWVVPHFEKMLYDNALLLRAYTHWWRASGAPLARRVALETAEFLLTDLRTPEGGFASSLDADSEGEEGRYYVWTPAQLADALGEDATWAAELLEVTAAGTFEHGASVLQLRCDPDDRERWERVRARLREARARRVPPGRDDKVVAAWNGLAIAGLAEAGALFERPELVEAAREAAELLVSLHLGGGEGDDDGDRMARVSRGGVAGTPAGVLEDYADVAEGLLALFAVTGEERWLAYAGVLLDVVLTHFGDGSGGFYDTAADTDDGVRLIHRPQDPTDNATPSGWSAAAAALLSYAAYTGSGQHRMAAEKALAGLADLCGQYPRFAGWALAAAEALLDGPREVAVVGTPSDPLRAELHAVALRGTAPGAVVALGDPDTVPAVGLLRDRPARDGVGTAYVCRHFVCAAPTSDPAELARQVAARI